MTAEAEQRITSDRARHAGAFARCTRCSLQVRSDEMAIHLAHAHNIGPPVTKEKGRDRRQERRPAGDQ